MLLLLALLPILLSQPIIVAGTADPCIQPDPHFNDVVFTGLSVGRKNCMRACNKHKKGNPTQIAILANNYCFCRNESSEKLITKPCPGPSTCDATMIPCLLHTFETHPTAKGVKGLTFHVPDEVIVEHEYEISASVLVGPSVTYQYQTYKDLWSNISNFTYLIPGNHLVKVKAENNESSALSEKKIVSAVSKVGTVFFDAPVVFEKGVAVETNLIIVSGSNLSIQITFKDAGTNHTFDLISDIPVRTIGPISSNIKAGLNNSVSVPDPSIIISPILTMPESGSVTSIELFAQTSGTLHLLILRPQCEFCFTEMKCDCVDKQTLFGNETEMKYNFNGIDPGVKVEVNQNVMVNVSKVGYQLLRVHSHKIAVKKGDMVGLVSSTDYVKVAFMTSSSSSYSYAPTGTPVIPGEVFTLSVHSNSLSQVPLMKVFLSKVVIFPLPTVLANEIGEVELKAEVSNHLGLVVVKNQTVMVQERISGLAFGEKKPKLASEGAYKLSDLWYEMKATIVTGSHVFYQFSIPELNSYMNSTTDTVVFRVDQVGTFTVNVTASNMINTETASVEFSILTKIMGQNIYLSSQLVDVNKTITVYVNILNGTGVTLEVDFGDGESETKIIDDARAKNGVFHNLTHTYNSCNKFTIKARVKNFITPDGTWEKFNHPYTDTTEISVACPLSHVKVLTSPVKAESGTVLLGVNTRLLLTISLESGSWAIYNISWGNNNTYVNHSTVVHPKTFTLSYSYRDAGSFDIFVAVSNGIKEIKSETIKVNVTQCSVPLVDFLYGTQSEPMTFSRGDSRLFVATWEVTNAVCISDVAAKFHFKEWVLENSNGTRSVNIEGFDGDKKTCSYHIEKQSLPEGSYKLILTMVYDAEEFKYESYIKIEQSQLIALIVNGNYQSIPMKKKIVESNINGKSNVTTQNTTYFNFTLDASVSYDPDAGRDEGVKGMTFKWYCSVLSNASIVNESAQAREEARNTTIVIYKPDLCRHQNLTELPVTGMHLAGSGKIRFNTEMFLENVRYKFEIRIKKGNRKASFVQEVLIVQGAPPMVEVRCVFNCKDKINPMEKIALTYICNDCPINERLVSKWTVTQDRTDISNKFVSNSNLSSTGINEQSLVISANTLKESSNHTFILEVKYEGSSAVSSYKTMRATSSKPFGGSCNILPLKGTARDYFKIKCSGWKNSDQPTTYEFRYDTGASPTMRLSSTIGADYPLLNPNTPNQPEQSGILMPLGLKSENYTIRLKLRIINKYGAYVSYDHLRVQVESPPVSGNSSSRLNNLLTSTPKSNDSQSLAAFVKSTISLVDQEAAVEKEKIEASGPVYFENSGLPDLEAEQKRKKEEERLRKQREEARQKMIDYLDIAPVDNIQDIKVISDALTSATTANDELSTNTMKTAVDVISKLTKSMGSLDASYIGVEYLEQSTKSVLSSISNLLKSDFSSVKTLQPVDDVANYIDSSEDSPTLSITTIPGVNTAETEKQAEESKANVNKLLSSLDKYFDVIEKNKLLSEVPSIGNTDSFSFLLNKVKASDLSSYNVTADPSANDDGVQYGFELPNTEDMLNLTSPSAQIFIQSVNYVNNVFSWDLNNSRFIKSDVTSLAFKAGNEELKVENSKKPIVIKIKNHLEDFQSENVTLYLPGQTVMKTMKLQSSSCNVIFNVKALNDFLNRTRLIVYAQYGKPPSAASHDVMLNISQSDGLMMTQKTGFVNITGSNATKSLNRVIERKSNILVLDQNTLLMWDFNSSTFGYLNNRKLYFSFSYDGPMPDLEETDNLYTYDVELNRGAFNYSMKTFCSECRFWDVENEKWSSSGCELDVNTTSLATTGCKCSHLTAFGGFYVSPNPLPTPSLALLKEGYVLLVTVGSILLLYIVGLVFARRADRRDVTKIGVCPLLDNQPNDSYLYEVTVNTGSRRYAGTKSNVFFNVTGEYAESGVRRLKDRERQTFQRSSSDVFIMTSQTSLGDISYLRIWHDNSGGGWYLRSLEIIDLQTEETYTFIASRWLAVDQADGFTQCLLPVSTKEELTDFNYLFTNKTRRDLSDAHIWFSVYARPPRSPFTRCQRLSVAISLLLCSMVASVMFYGAVPDGDPADENKMGAFSFKWSQVTIAIISAAITVPINLILVGIFRSVRPAHTDPSMFESTSEESVREEQDGYEMQPSSINEKLINGDTRGKKNSTHLGIKQEQSKKKKKPFYLPHWFIYPAWVLCVCAILGCGFMVVWYGMAFGNAKSLDWLASVTICLVQDVLLLQPLKVFAMALFIALVVKKLDEEEKSELEKQVKTLAQNEKWLHKLANESNIFDRVDTTTLEPPEKGTLDSMRNLRLKEVKMHAISRELILYLVFTVVVFLIGFLTRNQSAYYQTQDVEELLRLNVRTGANLSNYTEFKKIHSSDEFWPWVDNMLLEEIYPAKWFNLSSIYENSSESNFPGKLYLNDLSSKIVNGVRLRQVRVKEDSCDVDDFVKEVMTIDCADSYGLDNEEKRDFLYNWSKPTTYEDSINPRNKPWRFQTWQELDAYPIWAELDTYYGGGYVLELFPKWNNKAALDELKQKRWIDRHTRAIIVEFTLYNAGTNYFDSVTIVFEFPPTGGVIHYSSVVTFRLYRYTSGYAFFTILCEVLFLVFMIIFFIRETRLLYRTGWPYFREFWNLVEMGNFILSVLAVVFYFYRDVLAKDLLGRLPDKSPEVFINFQFAAYWDELFTYIVALICFFVTLKFIKLFRFNKRISMLSSTLKMAWYPLSMFAIIFCVVIAAVVSSTSIIFGTSLYGYRNNFKTIASIISLLLGKFSFHQYESTNRVLGPIFFFFFNVMVNWIIMNMFISILNDAFANVKAGIEEQDNEYEMLDFMTDRVKSWIGFGGKKRDAAVEDAYEEDKKTADKARQVHSTVMSRRIEMRNSSQASLRSGASVRSKTSSSFKKRLSHGFGELKRSMHWKDDELNQRDTSFLLDDSFDDDEMDETVNKFINCVNLLYFDDITVAKKMNDVVKDEIVKM